MLLFGRSTLRYWISLLKSASSDFQSDALRYREKRYQDEEAIVSRHLSVKGKNLAYRIKRPPLS